MHWYMKENAVPKSFPVKEREALLSELRELLRMAEMESCSFDGGLHTEFTPNDVTGYVKEVTKIWRGAWLVRPLKDLIARYESGLTTGAADEGYAPLEDHDPTADIERISKEGFPKSLRR